MIKIICNICGGEIVSKDFSYEAIKQQVATDLTTGQKTLKKEAIHVCRDCYDKKLKKIYGS